MTATTMCAAFAHTSRQAPGAVALRTSDGALEITWAQYAERVEAIASGLAALGVARGDTVALMLTNRPEFHLADAAAFHLGAAPFSLYNTLPAEDVAQILANAGSRVVITDRAHLPRVLAAGAVEHVVCVDGEDDGATLSLEQLERLAPPEGFDFEAAWRAVEPGDVLTLIYTSGTTGPPKGVELTHAALLAQCHAVREVLPIEAGDTITSYLPSAHIADRWSSHYNGIVFGVQVTDVADPATVVGVLGELRPTLWGGVPRVFEKMKAALESAVEADPEPARGEAVRAAITAGTERVRRLQAGQDAAPLPAAQEQVLAGLRAKLGLDRVRWIVCGAAPLSPAVHGFLLGIGLPVVELYGMSEASSMITTIAPEHVRVGTVGRPISAVETRIADDGELLVRGPTIMRGYRGMPERTAESIDADGWLHTGDIVHADDDGYLAIVDRKKELIISAGGKNMSPANIETKLKSAGPLIGQACVVGDKRPYNVALLVLDPDATAGLQGTGEELAALVEAEVAQANARLARVEQIKRYALLTEEWLPGGVELTPTMKLRRKPIEAKYAPTIEQLYGA